jgi:undecaprenyl diphosphate synthase
MFFWKKKENIENLQIPKHIAIIMDGNSRWAKLKKLPLSIGHKIGSQNLQKISEAAIEFGVKYLSVYAFSTENWQRPKDEINYLMRLLDEYLEKEVSSLMKKDVRITVSGNLEKLSEDMRQKISRIEDQTKNNKSLFLNVAFSYGSRAEIIDATKKIAELVLNNKISISDINEELLVKNLYNHEIPDPDLLIRTAGDLRISNFMLWQIAYSELYFTKKYWPDFSKKDLLLAIKDFNKRERRYGKR